MQTIQNAISLISPHNTEITASVPEASTLAPLPAKQAIEPALVGIAGGVMMGLLTYVVGAPIHSAFYYVQRLISRIPTSLSP